MDYKKEKEKIEKKFDQVKNQFEQANNQARQLGEELMKLQGEYRLIVALENEETLDKKDNK